jgi:hypothetical protein
MPLDRSSQGSVALHFADQQGEGAQHGAAASN